MRARLRAYTPQPLVGVLTVLGATALLVASFLASHGARLDLPAGGLAALLLALLTLTYMFPIHLRQNTKLLMGTVPLFMMAVLLSPPLAALSAGVGRVAANLALSARHDVDMLPSDIATDAGRSVPVVLAASLVAHLPFAGWYALPLVGAALLLWVGEMVTSTLVFCPITRESPWTVVRNSVREAGPLEAAQCLIGLLGGLAVVYGAWTLLLLALPIVLVYLMAKNTKEMHDSTRLLLEQTADLVDMRDPYTGGHSRRVAELTAGTLREMGLRGPEVELIVSAARLHDIGKIAIPDEVLRKHERLNEEEWAIMRTHPDQGAALLTRYPDFTRGIDIVRHHHENWDGSGYPHGLRGRDIPFGARIVAVADSFDAMTSDRPYRTGIAPARAAAIIRAGRAQQWDPEIADYFLKSIGQRDPELQGHDGASPEAAARTAASA